MKQREKDASGVLFPPPLAHLVMLITGLAIHSLRPKRFLPKGKVQFAIGLPFVGIAVILSVWAVRTMRQAATEINAYKPTTAIVMRGPFQFSRNPMYLSLTALYIGIATVVNSLWAILLLPVALVAISRGVIEREERYLERKFGEKYIRYKASRPTS